MEATMGLMDVINGMQKGPRGRPTPTGASRGGMSPITMAILGVLAYQAFKHLGGAGAARPGTQPAQPMPRTQPMPDTRPASDTGGGIGDLLGGGNLGGVLGSLLAGGAAGGVLSGGLNELLKQFQQGGQGDVAQSWIGRGENRSISPNELSKVLGEDEIRTLSAQTGMERAELLDALSEQLPQVVDYLTPEGRLPNEQEISRLV
jgi:uncharacterized protein YidB (DUF937 family)